VQPGWNCYELKPPSRTKRFLVSAVLHVLLLPIIFWIAAMAPPQPVLRPVKHETITWIPAEPMPLPPPPPRVLAELRKPEPQPVVKTPPPIPPPKVEARVEPPKIEAPKIQPPKIARVEPPKEVKPVPQFASEPAPVTPKPPKREVAVAGFDQPGGSSAKPTVNKPAAQVQTGGFGDPNGVRGVGDPKSKRVMIASLGDSFLPQGPGEGNGTGGRHGVPGTVKDSGFGTSVAEGGHGDGSQSRRGSGNGTNVGSFGGPPYSTSGSGSSKSSAPSRPATTPVEIVSKPKPAYTADARKQHIEGDVLLEVNFAASGRVEVLRVIRGLGYGLDETAQQAARRISFKPATREGHAVDSAAMVHIVFELAD
jgi:TonB family protein